jgi:hypothetical protein
MHRARTVVACGLSVMAVGLSVLAIFAYQWVTAVPRLGIGTLYYLRRIRVSVAALALSMAAAAWALRRSARQRVVFLVTAALTPLSGANHARRVLPSLHDPQHVPASEAALGDEAEVLGIEINGATCAWPLETLVPYHIIHDAVGGVPVAAAW